MNARLLSVLRWKSPIFPRKDRRFPPQDGNRSSEVLFARGVYTGYNDATPSLAQAIKMKKFMQEGKLTDEVIQSIMQEDKPNQKEKPAFKDERITKLIPKSIPRGQEADFVVKALEFYNRHLQRNKAHER